MQGRRVCVWGDTNILPWLCSGVEMPPGAPVMALGSCPPQAVSAVSSCSSAQAHPFIQAGLQPASLRI